jgi:hypothetical protein
VFSFFLTNFRSRRFLEIFILLNSFVSSKRNSIVIYVKKFLKVFIKSFILLIFCCLYLFRVDLFFNMQIGHPYQNLLTNTHISLHLLLQPFKTFLKNIEVKAHLIILSIWWGHILFSHFLFLQLILRCISPHLSLMITSLVRWLIYILVKILFLFWARLYVLMQTTFV